jgi:hypothetical protein
MKRLYVTGLLVAVLGLALVPAGCGNSPTAPSPFAGSWSGEVTDSQVGAGKLNLQLSSIPSDPSVTGNWATAFPIGANDNNGPLVGTVSGSSITAVLMPLYNPATCQLSLSATVSGSTMTGTYGAPNCALADSGSFSLSIVTSGAINQKDVDSRFARLWNAGPVRRTSARPTASASMFPAVYVSRRQVAR